MMNGGRSSLRTAVLIGLGFVSTQAGAACLTGPSSNPSESTLQQRFDSWLGPNAPHPSNVAPVAASDCVADGSDAQWESTDGTSGATILLELAGNAGINRFGIYDPDLDGADFIEIFQGNDNTGSQATIRVTETAPGTFRIRVTEDGSVRDLFVDGTDAFGFYLLGGDGTLYSDSSLNGGVDYLYAYRGNGSIWNNTAPPSVRNSVFDTDNYVLAWEDLKTADRDFQDFVVLIKDIAPIAPVPLPPAVLVFASGLVGLAGFARRRTRTT